MTKLDQAKVAILATNGFEQSELESPRDALRDAGASVSVVAPEGKTIKGWKDGNWGNAVDVDITLAEIDDQEFDALVLPGGVLNPDQLRINDAAIAFVKKFIKDGRIVAAICHAPWLLISADAVSGRKVTSYPSVRKDLENAGANWIDTAVVTDKGIVTSRNPDDLDAFNAKIIEEIREGRHRRAA
jgi:protease I